ncbi:uncharacterized protein LOC126667396 [Mercurialis annua]|uniref:uncharacterized protein LOC126667396 n=1 Tax=Mercurialis annua TaxID=3986 RepID=UPI00215E8ED7|nr:uncharacterized protein LOC126667396 [Mercurialis annua]
MPGRPKKNRRKDPDEEPKKDPRFARKGVAMTCRHCLTEGHNKRGCPDKNKAPAARPAKRAKGRPRGPQWVDKSVSRGTPSSATMKKQRKEELLQRTIAAQRNASTSEQRAEIHTVLENQVVQAEGIRINTRSGFVYSKPATNDGVRYVSGAVATAAAVRDQRPPTSTCISSQQGSTTTCDPQRPSSVMYKSTASQAATPRIGKLPLKKGKKKA